MFDWSSESEGKSLAIKDKLQLEQSQTPDLAVFVRRYVDRVGYAERLRTDCEPL